MGSTAKRKTWFFVRGNGLRGEKITRGGFIFQRGGGRQPVRKARQAGALFGGKRQAVRRKAPGAPL
jgi:hypothetical protein